jgi:hypothetical protein
MMDVGLTIAPCACGALMTFCCCNGVFEISLLFLKCFWLSLCWFDCVVNRDHAMIIDLWLVVCQGCHRQHCRVPWLGCKSHKSWVPARA